MSNFSWDDYLKFAKDVKKNPIQSVSDEANYRIGISRAYYAAYNHAKKYILKNNFQLSGDKYEWHGEIAEKLKNNTDTIQHGSKLGKLREKRNEADYEEEKELREGDLISCISWADDITQNLN